MTQVVLESIAEQLLLKTNWAEWAKYDSNLENFKKFLQKCLNASTSSKPKDILYWTSWKLVEGQV